MQKQPGFFDLQFRLEDLSKIGDPLIELNKVVEWEKFTTILQTARVKDCMARGIVSMAGRKPFSLRLMLKVFVLQSLYNLSDDQMEYQIKDRLSFMRFLGLGLNGTVPDAKTIWNYREMFIRTGVLEKLFRKFVTGCCATRATVDTHFPSARNAGTTGYQKSAVAASIRSAS